MISLVADRMLALDPGAASTALALWADWFDQGSGQRAHTRSDMRSFVEATQYDTRQLDWMENGAPYVGEEMEAPRVSRQVVLDLEPGGYIVLWTSCTVTA